MERGLSWTTKVPRLARVILTSKLYHRAYPSALLPRIGRGDVVYRDVGVEPDMLEGQDVRNNNIPVTFPLPNNRDGEARRRGETERRG